MTVIRKTMGAVLAAMFLNATPAPAMPVEIPGPAGPLRGEAIAVENARHAVVIIPGTGPIDRDGNAPSLGMSSDSYRLLAEALAAAGIASIRIDKRGFFDSVGAISNPEQVNIDGYAQDARGWVGKAAELAPNVWLAGHSEGGLVALVAATEPPPALSGLILISAAGRPVGELLVEQMGANPVMAAVMPDLRAIVADLEAGRQRAVERIPGPLQQMFTPGLQRYMVNLFSYDPAALARQWAGPVLILQGDRDIQVRVLDAGNLAAAMPQAEKRILPGMTHMLKADRPGQPFASYTNPLLPLDSGLLPAMVGFLDAHEAE